MAQSAYYKRKSTAKRNYYTEIRNYVNLAIKRKKLSYMEHKLKVNKNNPKQLWKDLREWGVTVKKYQKNQLVLPEHITADDINDFFIKATGNTTVDPNQISFYNSNRLNESEIFSFHEINIDVIYTVVKSIKSHAMGVDKINIKMLNIVLPFCTDLVLKIINLSLVTGAFPKEWKTSIVLPLPKISNAENVADLRPISILPVISKVLERVVFNQFKTFLGDQNIIPALQSGFRSSHSTQSALLSVVDDIAKATDESKLTFLILLDFSKAFDSVNFELFISKLKYIGCDDVVCNWFTNYLLNRLQIVKYNGLLSQPMQTKSGVPQGSILGPLLYTVYTFDLPYCIKHCQYHLYADDLQLYFSFNKYDIINASQKVNDDLNNIQTWCISHGLTINLKKTKILFI